MSGGKDFSGIEPFEQKVYLSSPTMHGEELEYVKEAYETEGKNIVTAFEKAILLHTIDEAWKENLRALDELQHSVQNASYEQKDPLLIFKLESVTLFDNILG